ncbi:carboxylesterase family protein, partial [Lichenihabitans sp. Uapishka_5]|uniref:carboxylesterase family protein n=1 Tax=Lichenihabitans sp. Uapishka_5 TaxID=3037302 RepID=UPI0029E7FE56
LGDGTGEDCLHLNIWSPAADARRRPVLVWVHGGAFTSGSGALYGGAPLAAGGDIVVVTVNYRLGGLGFVDFGSALGDPTVGRNLGLQDVMAALGWVRRNVAQFGGDPARVTLAGESAGSIMISALMATDAATLFDQAILQSGAFNLIHTAETGLTIARAWVEALRPRPQNLADLQALPAQAFVEAEAAVARAIPGASPAAPWFDGTVLPASLA